MPENLSSEYLPAQPRSGNGNGNSALSPTDSNVFLIQNWGQRVPMNRHPNFLRRMLEDERRLMNHPECTHGHCAFWLRLRTYSMLPHIPGSDGNGGWQVSIRTLARLLKSNEHSVIQWRDWLAKHQFLVVEKVPTFVRLPALKYYIQSVLTDERLTELLGGGSVALSGNGAVASSGNGDTASSGNGDTASSGNGGGASSGNGPVASNDSHPVASNGTLLSTPHKRGEGGGKAPPAPPPRGSAGDGAINEDPKQVPVFDPIPEDLWESRLRWMLKECEAEIHAVPTVHYTTHSVFLADYKYTTLIQMAEWLEKSGKPDELKRAVDCRQNAQDLKDDPSNYIERKVISPLGKQIKAAWEARRNEVRKRLLRQRT
jgi:hypothetical protein